MRVEKAANNTKLSFVIWVGSEMYHVGLDGESNEYFRQGGSWGASETSIGTVSALQSDQNHTLTLQRQQDSVSVSLDGAAIMTLSLSGAVTAIGWRPHLNTIEISDLVAEHQLSTPKWLLWNATITHEEECSKLCMDYEKCIGFEVWPKNYTYPMAECLLLNAGVTCWAVNASSVLLPQGAGATEGQPQTLTQSTTNSMFIIPFQLISCCTPSS